jgi:hypothetical protein
MLFDVSEKTKEASDSFFFAGSIAWLRALRSTTDSSALTLQLAWTFEERDDSVRMTQEKSSRVARGYISPSPPSGHPKVLFWRNKRIPSRSTPLRISENIKGH